MSYDTEKVKELATRDLSFSLKDNSLSHKNTRPYISTCLAGFCLSFLTPKDREILQLREFSKLRFFT